MPTPMRSGVGEPGGVSPRSSLGWGNIVSSQKVLPIRNASREDPPRKLNEEEACDQRSLPQDVTSSESNTEGSICSKRSRLTRPKDLPATCPGWSIPADAIVGVK